MPVVGQKVIIDILPDEYTVSQIEKYNPTDSVLISNNRTHEISRLVITNGKWQIEYFSEPHVVQFRTETKTQRIPIIPLPTVQKSPIIPLPTVQKSPIIPLPNVQKSPIMPLPTVQKSPPRDLPTAQKSPTRELPIVFPGGLGGSVVPLPTMERAPRVPRHIELPVIKPKPLIDTTIPFVPPPPRPYTEYTPPPPRKLPETPFTRLLSAMYEAERDKSKFSEGGESDILGNIIWNLEEPLGNAYYMSRDETEILEGEDLMNQLKQTYLLPLSKSVGLQIRDMHYRLTAAPGAPGIDYWTLLEAIQTIIQGNPGNFRIESAFGGFAKDTVPSNIPGEEEEILRLYAY